MKKVINALLRKNDFTLISITADISHVA